MSVRYQEPFPCRLGIVLLLVTGGVDRASADPWEWAPVPGVSAPTNQSLLSAVWTGSEVLYWGGQIHDGKYEWLSSGYRLNPRTGVWRPIAVSGAPAARYLHTALWTGREMVLWGGQIAGQHELANSGGCYDPVSDTWRPTPLADAPRGRLGHTAVWTGTQMIVWGGYDDGVQFNTGGCYHPPTDTWTPTSTTGAPSARDIHTAIWSGTRMIVWGGYDGAQYINTGGCYNPSADTWTPTAAKGAPATRSGHTAIWTGSEMIIWGGTHKLDEGIIHLRSGGRYDPLKRTWAPSFSTIGAPERRYGHTAVWTGTEMIVWGGDDGGRLFRNGGRYNPSADTWARTTRIGAPTARAFHTAVWTGTEMIIWGGYDGSDFLRTGGRYTP